MKRLAKRLAGTLLLAALAVPALADDAAELIQKMARAMEELSYEGTFVYLHDGQVETISVLHDFGEQGVREKLVSLNGEARVILRDDDNLTCIWPGSKSVVVSKSGPRTPFLRIGGDDDSLTHFYELKTLGRDRVAGHQSHIVSLMPRDSFRYGYKLWVADPSGLLLRSAMLDEQGRAVEQVMFTELVLLDAVEDARFAVEDPGPGYSVHRVGDMTSGDHPADMARIGFAEDSLPPGFVKLSEKVKPMPMDGNPVHHAVLSDGVATVSVYVELMSDEQAGKAYHGATSMGAVHVFARQLDAAYVTAVGEAPAVTVKKIAESVSLQP
ncbi:MucB/RseB C-terminal domain-containing protein [Granulosicoccaceae sp. 1_MG-2023]|nr:MucB/RseB C-terminal domain-containing protein [Granulosicoccaceae sp. 1_MG-2023]